VKKRQDIDYFLDFWPGKGKPRTIFGQIIYNIKCGEIGMVGACQTAHASDWPVPTIDTTWGAENIFGHPTELWPRSDLSCHGPEYGRYIETAGGEGREPTPEVARVEELFQMASSVPDEEAKVMAAELWQIIIDQQWAIGTVGMSPTIQGVRVVKNTMGNIPARQTNSAVTGNPGAARPEQWYFKE
jgi:hypothetical protein